MDPPKIHFRNPAIELAHCVPGVLERVLFSSRDVFIDLFNLVDKIIVKIFSNLLFVYN